MHALRVNAERLGRVARTLRVRQRFTQAALASHAGVSQRAVSALERGQGACLSLDTVAAVVAALGGRLDARIFWNGPELDRLLDAGHSTVASAVKRRLERWGWRVRVEVSFSRFGERGRIDLLAFQPERRILLVIEVKTELVDVQALLGSLDQKTRLATTVAQPFGWRATAIVPAIVFLEHSATRKRLGMVDTLFDRYSLRGRAAVTWLREPTMPAPSGLLWFTAAGARRDVPRERVRRVPGESVRHARLG
jgi:transcriptional regulator with XRE-family HTH domain